MAMGSLEDHVLDAVRQLVPALRLENLKTIILRGADKSDALDLRAVIVAEASVAGQACAWIVECPNDRTQEVVGRLIREIVNAIAANPGQLRSAAPANRVILT